MRQSTYLDDLVIWTPAKVNLFLEILGKRPDGYHEIATLMAAIRLFDTLVFRAAPSCELTLACSDRQLSTGPDNLVLKAARLLQTRTNCQRGAAIRLIKRIPMAAGLAGGSSDAAATLMGLNRLWKLGLSNGELAGLAGELGSDIPFFLHTPAAWCTGRGEIVTPMSLPSPFHLVLLCPSFGLATAAVYKNVVVPPASVSGIAIQDALRKGDIDLLGRLMHNRLQQAAETLEPRIGEFARMLGEAGSAGSLMSGSGSTLFAVCRTADEAQVVAARLESQAKDHDFKLIVTRSL